MTDGTRISAGSELRHGAMVSYIVAAIFFLQLLDSTIIATSLPHIAEGFGTDPVALGSGFTIYMLTMAAVIPAAGWLSERYGGRRVLLWSVAGFALASLGCGLSTSLGPFLVARGAQGAAAAVMAPVGRILVLRHTPKSGVIQAIATITWPALLAPVLGPVVGAWITTHAGWQWNFLINLPLCGLALAAILAFIPPEDPEAARRFDAAGFAMSSGAILLLLGGLELFIAGAPAAAAAVSVAAGIVLAAATVRHLRRAAAPLLDLDVLRVPTFAHATLAAGSFSRVAINAPPFLLPLLFQVGFGLDAIAAGSLVLVYFLGNLAMKTVTTPILQHVGFRRLLVWNGLLAAGCVASFAAVTADMPGPILWALLFAAGLTRSMQFTGIATLAVADLEGPQRASGMSLSAMTQQISMLLAVALSVLTVRVSQAVAGREASDAVVADFRAAFLVMGGIGAVAALRFLGLAATAGQAATTRRRQS